MNPVAIEHRVLKLELTVDNHGEDLKELRDSSHKLGEALKGIEANLNQIKWVAFGAALVLFGKVLGADKIIAILLGV